MATVTLKISFLPSLNSADSFMFRIRLILWAIKGQYLNFFEFNWQNISLINYKNFALLFDMSCLLYNCTTTCLLHTYFQLFLVGFICTVSIAKAEFESQKFWVIQLEHTISATDKLEFMVPVAYFWIFISYQVSP